MSGLTTQHIVDCDIVPIVPHGCSIEEHKKDGQLSLDMSRVELHLSQNQVDGSIIEGNKLREELTSRSVPVLNANVLSYLLQNQELIPESWKCDVNNRTRQIFFWGTIFRSRSLLFVQYMYWDNNSMWWWNYRRLDRVWSKGSPAATFTS